MVFITCGCHASSFRGRRISLRARFIFTYRNYELKEQASLRSLFQPFYFLAHRMITPRKQKDFEALDKSSNGVNILWPETNKSRSTLLASFHTLHRTIWQNEQIAENSYTPHLTHLKPVLLGFKKNGGGGGQTMQTRCFARDITCISSTRYRRRGKVGRRTRILERARSDLWTSGGRTV